MLRTFRIVSKKSKLWPLHVVGRVKDQNEVEAIILINGARCDRLRA